MSPPPLPYEQIEESSSYAIINKIALARVENLGDTFRSFHSDTGNQEQGQEQQGEEVVEKAQNKHKIVLVDVIRTPQDTSNTSIAFYRACHRPNQLHFDPHTVRAAIVTCGGLCPGLNNVVREVVNSLRNIYGVKTVWGVTGGWNGFHNDRYEPVPLTPAVVRHIHHGGGSFLRTSRGGFDVDKTIAFLQNRNINQLYVIGGDGTHRAAHKVHEACQERKLNIAVAGVPKTIDNDVDYIDRSFGFNSAVEAAQNAIRVGLTEAQCTLPNGIAVIKLMGREAGYLGAFAALASNDVDLVLVPECPIVLEGEDGILPFLLERVKQKNYAVVVVSEGAGQDLVGATQMKEAGSGNKILAPIAEFIRDQISSYFEKQGVDARMKYIDPSYMVRGVPANSSDSLYCSELAQNAVHCAMAGFTGFSVGLVNNTLVMIPIPHLTATSPRAMNLEQKGGEIWNRVIAMTGQPRPSRKVCDNNPEAPRRPEPVSR